MLDFLREYWMQFVGTATIATLSTGKAIQKSIDHERRITAVELEKIDKSECYVVQSNNQDKFEAGGEEFTEIKKLISESNALHQKHHDDLVKIIMDKL